MICRVGILSLLEMVTIYREEAPVEAIELYDALAAAGAPEEKSRAAAVQDGRDVADVEREG